MNTMSSDEPILQFSAFAGGGLDAALEGGRLHPKTQPVSAGEREALNRFRQQVRSLMMRFETATDPQTRARVARTVEEAARSIGARRVMIAATALERRARGGEPSGYELAELAESVAEVASVIELRLMDR
jgi:hypothetical protein